MDGHALVHEGFHFIQVTADVIKIKPVGKELALAGHDQRRGTIVPA